MDVSFSSVLEGTRQYFLGLPKQAGEGGAWAAPEEPAPAQSGAPTPTAPPPSAAAAPPPPRPPSEPIEPEPHIIHKATVMREAAEKRRERPEPDDDDDAASALSPPPHIIRRPQHEPAPAQSPRPPSKAPTPVAPSPSDPLARGPTPHGAPSLSRPPEHFAPARPPDPYSSSRPPEHYSPRYYETPNGGVEGRPMGPLPSPQPPPRHGSPQTYARLSSTLPAHAARLREGAAHSPPAQRYSMPASAHPPPPHNDRVPPIHHPMPTMPPSSSQRVPVPDARSVQYPPLPQHREPSPYGRASHYERHPTIPQRKYDPQQAYPGYRPSPPIQQTVSSQRVDPHHAVQYKHGAVDAMSAHYPPKPMERVPAPQYLYQQETVRRTEYPSINRSVADTRSNYHYPTPSTSSARYAPVAQSAVMPAVQPSAPPPRPVPRPAAAPRSNYEYPTSNHVQTSPARSTVKPGYPNQQARMTVSVTTLVNQMNQTKQKRESPLDLSVKTVKNSADSSTTQDDVVDSASMESKILPLPSRPTSSNRLSAAVPGFAESHKVDFAPDFSQYRERSSNHSYPASVPQPGQPPLRYNGAYDNRRPPETYPVESRQHVYPERNKYNVPVARAEYVPRIDLTRPVAGEHRPEKIRDDRHFIIEERKRPAGPIVSNIPEKIVRHETWTADSRIDRMTQSAREQRELMSQPVYSYSSHKQYEAYQNEQKRLASTSYRDHHHHHQHMNSRYPYPPEVPPRERHDYHAHAHPHDRNPSISSRQVIQKIPSHRDIHPHQMDPHSGIPADKRVLSILRNSLETKQGFVEPARSAKQIPDLIVIDDVDDAVIEITDLTKDETQIKTPRPVQSQGPIIGHHIQMPKAVDSIDNSDSKSPPENDVASRIRTKAELKSMPPSDNTLRPEQKQEEPVKVLPKSQKQHLFNQIREDQTLESVIKSEKTSETTLPEVKSEPMNIDEIEKDAVMHIKTENRCDSLVTENVERLNTPEPEDLDWASACDNFMEQLKTGVHKKKTHRRRLDTTDRDNESKSNDMKVESVDSTLEIAVEPSVAADRSLIDDHPLVIEAPIVIKQEPLDEEEMKEPVESVLSSAPEITEDVKPVISCELHEKVTTTDKTDKIETILSTEDVVGPQKVTSPEKIVKKKVLTPKESEKDKTLKLADQSKKDEEKSVKAKQSLPETPAKEKRKFRKSLLGEKSKLQGKSKKSLTLQEEKDKANNKKSSTSLTLQEEKDKANNKKSSTSNGDKESPRGRPKKTSISQDTSDSDKGKPKAKKTQDSFEKYKKLTTKDEKNRVLRTSTKLTPKDKPSGKTKVKSEKSDDTSSTSTVTIKKEKIDDEPLKVTVKEECESTDEDEPLIKSKLQKEKDMKYRLLKDFTEKSAYVKLECFDVDLNKNTRISVDSLTKEKEDKQTKGKLTRQASKCKEKVVENKTNEKHNEDSSATSCDEEVAITTRLRVRKSTKTEDSKTISGVHKTPAKSSQRKQDQSASNCSTPLRKPGFGDGSDFRPGWEEELFKYKRSLRMPTRLIAIPRGHSDGPFVKGIEASYNRGSTSLPDLDPVPLSPAPSSAPSAATDADLYTRRQDKLTLDSDLESNCSYSATNRLHYDSEASTSTVFSTTAKKRGSSIVDVLIQKCGKHDSSKKKSKDKDKEKDEKTPKIIPKSMNPNELLPTPSLGLLKNGSKGSLSATKEKLMEDIFYLGAFRKETVNAYRNAFIKNTDGLIGATEEFAPVVLKSRTRTESRVLKQRATIKEVFGDERPASAPPTSCRDEEDAQEPEDEPVVEIKQEKEPEAKAKPKLKNIEKGKLKRRSSSIRDGLRSTKSLKRNDAKGRLLRLKKRNSLMKSLANKRMKDLGNKIKKEKPENHEESDKSKEQGGAPSTGEGTKRRLKRLFGRRKFSSGFDYIRKKKKIIRRDDTPNNKIRRPAVKPSPESVHDIQKEIKGWFINKSVGETHLHRAARLGYTDCVAYCLEKMEADASAKDNAGFTPLHVASAKGHVRIARLLLQYGANVSAAANGGIRPLHEACENCHVEVIRLLLAYGADPLLGTYAGQTPEELAEGEAARLLRLHIADVQGKAIEPWKFPPPAEIIDRDELGCDPLLSPPPASPPPPPDSMIEMQCTDFPLPPFYSLKTGPGQPADGLWCLLQDITNLLQIKSKESLLKQIHCGSGSPKDLLREIRTQEFLERAQCQQLICAGEKVNIRASKVSLVRVTDKLRQLLKIETVLIS